MKQHIFRLKRPNSGKAPPPLPTKQMKDEVNSLRKENDDLRAENEDVGHALELKKRELFLNTANENDDASLLAKLKVCF